MRHVVPVFFAMLLIGLCVTLGAMPVGAVSEGDVKYLGGTVASLRIGVVGHLDPTSQSKLVYRAGSTTLTIPYESIDSIDYRKVAAHHLGVLPLIAVSLAKHRQMRHEIRVVYEDDAHEKQIAIFEVSKEFPRVTMPTLKVRCPVAFRSTTAERAGPYDYLHREDADVWK
jgi:hypothetical protein